MAPDIVGAERREITETIRVGFLEEMTCQLTVGSQGYFRGQRGFCFLLQKLIGTGNEQDLRMDPTCEMDCPPLVSGWCSETWTLRKT